MTLRRESRSENDGITQVTPTDKHVLSIGISTAGDAEFRMLELDSERYVIATTLDSNGAEAVRQKAERQGMQNRLEVRIEDVSDDVSHYPSSSFDFIYARLVLHYLSKKKLGVALNNLYTLLKSGGRAFIVVRSTECEEAQNPSSTYEEETGLTTYTPRGSQIVCKRYFHTQDSISKALSDAEFTIVRTEQFDELLSPGFNRDSGIWISNNVIEVIARKI